MKDARHRERKSERCMAQKMMKDTAKERVKHARAKRDRVGERKKYATTERKEERNVKL